jgi:hypothetical protein
VFTFQHKNAVETPEKERRDEQPHKEVAIKEDAVVVEKEPKVAIPQTTDRSVMAERKKGEMSGW